MENAEAAVRVRELRAEGKSVKQIARTLGLRPTAVAPLVNAVIAEEYPGSREVLGCWIRPGWSEGLTLTGRWADADPGGVGSGADGLVGVLLARHDRPGQTRVCGYLVDVYCLGVKDVVGPRLIDIDDLPEFTANFFSAFDTQPLDAPVELAQALVHGAVAYARGLGFTPAPGFREAAEHLGPDGPDSGIVFGREGKPFFVQGPRDDQARILRTLDRTVGQGNYEYLITVL
jgi:hypothetical protein